MIVTLAILTTLHFGAVDGFVADQSVPYFTETVTDEWTKPEWATIEREQGITFTDTWLPATPTLIDATAGVYQPVRAKSYPDHPT